MFLGQFKNHSGPFWPWHQLIKYEVYQSLLSSAIQAHKTAQPRIPTLISSLIWFTVGELKELLRRAKKSNSSSNLSGTMSTSSRQSPVVLATFLQVQCVAPQGRRRAGSLNSNELEFVILLSSSKRVFSSGVKSRVALGSKNLLNIQESW